jgi:hypothetical protein
MFLFAASLNFAQPKTLILLSSQDNSLIANALVYSGDDFLGATNQKGQIEIETSFQILKAVRENFDDAAFTLSEIEKLKWTIKLQPLTYIQLDDVVVRSTQETVSNILEKIKASRFKQNSKPFNYYQSNVNFKLDAQTIFSFNTIIYPSVGLKVNDKNDIIYIGKIAKNSFGNNFSEYFEINKNRIEIPIRTSVYCSLGSHEITPIFDEKLYNHQINQSEDYIILKFFPKKKNSKLLYDGYFIIDRIDFGIIELSMTLANSKKNIWWANSFDMKEIYEYQIQEDTFRFKFSKVEEHYFLEDSSRVLIGIQTKGNHIGAKLECRLYNEQTLDAGSLVFRSYDWQTHKFK